LDCNPITSNTATLNIFADPEITTQPISGCSDVDYELTVVATGTAPGALQYQWQSSTSSGGTYSNIVGATSATYIAPAPTSPRYYRVLITQSQSECSTTSAVAIVNPRGQVNEPADQEVCDDETT